MIEPTASVDVSDVQRMFMTRVYRWMFLGLGLTALVAYGISDSPAILEPLLMNRGLRIGLLLGQLGLVIVLSAMATRLSGAVATLLFFAYAALNGVTFSTLLYVYDPASTARAFLLTALTFGGMSIYGTVTRRDLTGWGSFLFMGLFGVVIAGLINLFVGSSMMSFVISCASVVIFTGLTAYDTQKLRAMALAAESGTQVQSLSILGALTLYLDFINLMLALLRLTGDRRR
ncbi:MAG: Bax inhibitor-1/YccA family protein [Myxococcaceae bacterium]